MGLPLRWKNKKRLPTRVKEPIIIPDRFTHTWSIDFVSDALVNGRKFRSFNVIDDFNREVLFIETDYSLKSSRVIWVLKHLVAKHGKPKRIRMDNGPDGAGLPVYCEPGTGMEHGQRNRVQVYSTAQASPKCSDSRSGAERFNKSYREGVLDVNLFEIIDQVREISQEWVWDFNNHRPHDALKGMSPVMYREQQESLFLNRTKNGKLTTH
ncbi:MAG: putative transposase [Vicingaceae bacterium]|jgi:putative transposase